jgi:ADP-ribose diphosphatase
VGGFDQDELSLGRNSYFVETEASANAEACELGITVKLVTLAELARLIRSGEFVLQLHSGALLLAALAAIWT